MVISTAKIPIVRFTSKEGIQVDIQFGNIEPIRSTLYVRTCVEFDERVKFIIYWLSNQFNNEGILNSSARLFSRYHVNLLAIHFLQAMPYPVLPNLILVCPWLKPHSNWNNAVKVLQKQGSIYVPFSESSNEMSIGFIIIQMIDYFSQVFDFWKMSTPETSTILKPSEAVRGMTNLDKSQFSVNVDFPVIVVDSHDVGKLSRRIGLQDYLIGSKYKPLKSFMDKENDMKEVVFHPDKVNSEDVRNKILKIIENQLGEEKTSKLKFDTSTKELTFEHFDAKTLIKSVLPNELDFSSFTQTGHIIHCNFVDKLLPFRYVIANILLEKNQKCRTVVQKGDIITSVYRNLDLELLAGEQDYVTELKEEGLRYKLDFSKVYWNSRLSNEHIRIINRFNSQSIVYDACCGIGPFVLPAYSKKKPRRIIANDLNPESVKWLITNIELNHIKTEAIEVHNIDAMEFIKTIVAEDAVKEMKAYCPPKSPGEEPQIHVVMNLPAFAINFLPAFRGVLRNRIDDIDESKRFKWNVHCYLFAKSHVDVEDDWYEKEARRMVDEMIGWKHSLIESCHNVRTVSSRKEMFCVHIELSYDYLTAEENQTDDEPCNKRIKT
ncbi:unnamed protein product [Caenorhabditis bovis]|uniref:tRNA (guanine(37)-N1)-methyltransferase n=1 Tax=Caenorhabditis bovis TaxID=2654633 RepID=A0A8S1ECG2_9PELO|nr:unnamed protein product [Caenorhabditis bovis]